MWKAVIGYEGYYEVSDSGAVRSVRRYVTGSNGVTRLLNGKEMTQTEASTGGRDSSGYLVVNLHKGHGSNVIPVHRIVAEAFLDNTNGYPTVNHKDGNKHNNSVGNLEWASYSMNNAHALRTNLREPRGVRIVQKTIDGDVVCTFKSVCEASRRTGISRGMISHCVNGRAKSAGGFAWEKIKKCNDYPDHGSTPEDEFPAEAQEPHHAEDIVCSGGNV